MLFPSSCLLGDQHRVVQLAFLIITSTDFSCFLLPVAMLSALCFGLCRKRCSSPLLQFSQLAQREYNYLHYCREHGGGWKMLLRNKHGKQFVSFLSKSVWWWGSLNWKLCLLQKKSKLCLFCPALWLLNKTVFEETYMNIKLHFYCFSLISHSIIEWWFVKLVTASYYWTCSEIFLKIRGHTHGFTRMHNSEEETLLWEHAWALHCVKNCCLRSV